MKSEKIIKADYSPDFATFPLAESEKTIEDSMVSIPSEDNVNEVKDWVDFKEM